MLRTSSAYPDDSLLDFMAKFSIPWIIAWQYVVDSSDSPPSLCRQIASKWWDKFNYGHINPSQIEKMADLYVQAQDFQPPPKPCDMDKLSTLKRTIKAKILSKTPKISKKELQQQIVVQLTAAIPDSDSDNDLENFDKYAPPNGDDCYGVIFP